MGGVDAYIILMGLLALPILYPYGNMDAIDAWFFGASASTESGLNTSVADYPLKLNVTDGVFVASMSRR